MNKKKDCLNCDLKVLCAITNLQNNKKFCLKKYILSTINMLLHYKKNGDKNE